MTKFCESCHTPNRDHAKYCRGCAGRFSGIVSGTTAFDIPRALDPASTARAAAMAMEAGGFQPRRQPAPPGALRNPPATAKSQADAEPAADAGARVVRLGIFLALTLCAVVLWYWGRPAADGSAPRWREAGSFFSQQRQQQQQPTAVAPVVHTPPAATVAPAKSVAVPGKDPAAVAAYSHVEVVQRALALSPAAKPPQQERDPQAEDHLMQDVAPPANARQRPEPVKIARSEPARHRAFRSQPPSSSESADALARLQSPRPPATAPIEATMPAMPRGASACAPEDQALCVPFTSGRAGR